MLLGKYPHLLSVKVEIPVPLLYRGRIAVIRPLFFHSGLKFQVAGPEGQPKKDIKKAPSGTVSDQTRNKQTRK
ncbi:hypothetical protein HMPREF9413_4433 [Paenibacillus sp. HGF7]|nr:hypothetical protein HMPREF9413_4433 [Paenibacillus sp. HGF7]